MMKLLSLSIILTCGFITQVFPKRMTASDIAYMQRYGYMVDPISEGEQHTDEEMKQGLWRFQKFNGMEVTGNMSDGMHIMMAKPRCGMKDMMLDSPSTNNRARRYTTTGTRWPNKALKYKFINYSPDLGQSVTEAAIKRALRVWSDVTPLTFEEVDPYSAADIDILFQGGEHGDGIESSFDGPYGVLAHAYFPSPGLGGDAHFDEDELFSVNGEIERGIDLFQVAAHEFGHSMGLGHSEVQGALMAPYYAGYIQDFRLPEDDINGIQFLYGPKPVDTPGVDPKEPETGGDMEPTIPPNVPANIDAVLYDQKGVYIFQRDMITRLEMRGTPMADYPQPISSVFRGLENNIDAAYYRFTDATHFFFKNKLYWEFDGSRELKGGFPKDISQFDRTLPTNIDAVITWGSRYTYFFKGDNYYRYNERNNSVDNGYPRSINIWTGLPVNVDAGFRWLDGELYFVKDENYYFYDARNGGINTNVYPRSFREEWLRFGPDSFTYIYSSSSAHKHAYSVSVLLVALAGVLYL